MITRLILAALVGLGLVPEAGAKVRELTLKELTEVQSDLKDFQTLTVDFTQARYSALRQKERKTEGAAKFAKPNRFRWTLEGPATSDWIFDGTQLYQFNAKTKSAVRYAASGGKARELRQIVDLVMNMSSLLKRFKLKKAVQEGDLVKIELGPKAKSDITAVELHLDTKADYITFLRLHFGKNYTSLDFRNPKRGDLPPDTFALPKGVKITDSY